MRSSAAFTRSGSQTSQTPVRLVAIDDEPQVLQIIRESLEDNEIEVTTCSDPEEAYELIRRTRPDLVLSDITMPKMTGMELLERIPAVSPATDIILMTAYYSIESAVEAISKGASDYIEKPFSIEQLRARIGKLAENVRRTRRHAELDRESLDASRFEGMVGRSSRMMELFSRILRIAPHFRTALVTGPTGTGKELAARALHRLSPVANGPFIVCNCSAIVETLFESELFGHVRGAFTDAIKDKAGLFEHADGGVLFLDEIGDMPLAAQAKILRALQHGEVQRVGSPVPRKVNVRVVAATHQPLLAMVAEKQFREDLYYRLSMVEVKLPPLSERLDDLPLLTQHFIERFSEQYGKTIRGLTRRASSVLTGYPWPGNVRELENVLGHACMMADGEMIDVRDFPERLFTVADRAGEHEDMLSLEEASRRHVLHVLERLGGNKLKAAEVLGISRGTLYRILEDSAAEERQG